MGEIAPSFVSCHILYLRNVTSWKKVNLALITYWGKDKSEHIFIILAHKKAGAHFDFFSGDNYNTQNGLYLKLYKPIILVLYIYIYFYLLSRKNKLEQFSAK